VHYTVDSANAFGDIDAATFGNGVNTVIGHDTAGYIGTIYSGRNGSYNSKDVQNLSYSYDSLGNVKTRQDRSIIGKYINETFTYDDHNRLHTLSVSSLVIGNYAKEKVYNYYTTGNIKSVYAYNSSSKQHYHSSNIGTYTYHASMPHAVKTAGTKNYTYDTVGNMTTRNGDTITYNPINKPASMRKSGASSSQTVHFSYGAGNARYLKRVGSKYTYYLGKAYEEQVEGNEIKQTVYIQLGGKTIGTHVTNIDTDL